MARIIVVPERLRSLSGELQRSAEDLRVSEGRLGNVMSGLDWETRQRAGVEGRWNEARSRARACTGQAESMARILMAKANAFEEADRQGAAGFPRIPPPTIITLPIRRPLPWPYPFTPIVIPWLPDALRSLVIQFQRSVERAWESLLRFRESIGDRGTKDDGGNRPFPPDGPAPPEARRWTEDEIKEKIKSELDGRLPKGYQEGEECVEWARFRRQYLGGSFLPTIGSYPFKDVGADNFIRIFNGSAVKIERTNVQALLPSMQPGAALVGLRSDGFPPVGHIAIVEAVQEDGVWISQSNYKPTRSDEDPRIHFYKFEELVGQYLIPTSAKPI